MNTLPYDQQELEEDMAGLKLDGIAYLCFCKTHDLIYSPFMVMRIFQMRLAGSSASFIQTTWTLAAYFYSKPAKALMCVKMP